MSSTKCPNCNSEISPDAAFCSHCGQQLPKSYARKRKTLIVVLCTLAAALLVPIALLGACSAITEGSQSNTIEVGKPFTLDSGEYTITGIHCGTQLKTRYLAIDYSATNTTSSTQNLDLGGSLYSPDGHYVNTAGIVTLDTFNNKTSSSLVTPGTTISASNAFYIAGDGEYTYNIGEKEFTFSISNSNAADIGDVGVSY